MQGMRDGEGKGRQQEFDVQGMRDGEGKGRQPDTTTTATHRGPYPHGSEGLGARVRKNGQGFRGGYSRGNSLWRGGKGLEGQGGAVVFLVAVLVV
jgi:hypothetical protein